MQETNCCNPDQNQNRAGNESAKTPSEYIARTPRIADLPQEDRPRERLIALGPKQLTASELIAILLGSGTRQLSALDLAREIIARADNRPANLLSFSLEQFKTIPGIGDARALTLMAAFELGYRLASEQPPENRTISCTQDIAALMRPIFMGLDHEQVWIIHLDNKNRVIDKRMHTKGAYNHSIIDIKAILREALEMRAHAIIAVHNHPSGDTTPSRSDLLNTQKLINAAALLDIQLLDHVIISNNKYASILDHMETNPL